MNFRKERIKAVMYKKNLKKKQKKEQGVTLVALVLYIILSFTTIVILFNLTNIVNANYVKINSNSISSEDFNKFNVNFVADIKKNENASVEDNNDSGNVKIVLNPSSTIYQYISEEKAIYRNKVKIAKNISYFTAATTTLNHKKVVKVKIATGTSKNIDEAEFGKTINYVLKYW